MLIKIGDQRSHSVTDEPSKKTAIQSTEENSKQVVNFNQRIKQDQFK